MISIIIPVIREDKAQRCIKTIHEIMSQETHIEYEITAMTDFDGIGCPLMVKKLVELSKGDMVMFLGDDTIPQPGFLDAALEAMFTLPDKWGVVGLNTQDDRVGKGGNPKAHWMAHKKMLDLIPGGDFFSTDYRHCYGDDELYDIANEHGRWAFAENCHIIHNHPVNRTAKVDEHYLKAYENGAFDHDRKTYYQRKIDRKGLNIAVGFPLTGTQMNRLFSASYRQAVYTYLSLPGVPPIKEYEPEVPIGQFARDIAGNRNDLVRRALEDGVSHLIMMDTDQIYPKDIIIKMATWAARGKDVVIGPVHRRYDPFELILIRGENPDKYLSIPDEEKYSGKMIEVDAGGTGCIMFSLKAALEIGDPWFSLDEKTPAGGNMGEDIAFCWKMKQKGYQLWADTSIEIGHIVPEFVINREFHEIWKTLTNKAFGKVEDAA